MNKPFVSGGSSVILALAMAISACAPTAAPPSGQPSGAASPAPARAASPTPASAPASAPQYGGKLIHMYSGGASTTDGQQDVEANFLSAPGYDTLIQYDAESGEKLVPALATSWDVAANGTITFKIRQGVKFHDGTSLTTDDVAFNLERIIFPPQGVKSNLAFLLRPVTDKIERVDESSVRVVLKYPFPAFLPTIAIEYAPIYSKALVAKKGNMTSDVMGTGPFVLGEYVPKQYVEFKKSDTYWEKGRPYLDGVRIQMIMDPATRVAAMRTHQVQTTGRIFDAFTPSEVQSIKSNAPSVVFRPVIAAGAGPWLFMNTKKPPFNDIRVRRAVNLSINRYSAIATIAENDGKLASFFNGIKDWGLTDEELVKLPGFAKDKKAEMEQARALLREAKLESGFDLDILSRANTLTRLSSEFLGGQMQEIGIRSKVSLLEDGVLFPRGGRGDFAALVYTPGFLVADPIWMGRYYIPGGTLNFTGNEGDDKLKSLWTQQSQELDSAKRKDLIKQIARHSWEQLYAIPVVWPQVYTAWWPEVQGMVVPVTNYTRNNVSHVWIKR